MSLPKELSHLFDLLRQPLMRRRSLRIGTLIESWPPDQTRRGKRLLLHWFRGRHPHWADALTVNLQ